jgi:hypothetical protein
MTTTTTIDSTFVLPEREFDAENREITYTWMLDQPWDGEADSTTEVTLSISHNKDRKMIHAWLSRAGVSRRNGYGIRHMHVAPGEGITIDRVGVARYSKKALETAADSAARQFLGYLKGNGNADIADLVYEVANGRNYRTGK